MKPVFTKQLFSQLLSDMQRCRGGELSAGRYLVCMQQAFDEAGHGDWFRERLELELSRKRRRSARSYAALRLLRLVAACGIYSRKKFAVACIRHAVSSVAENAWGGFDVLKSYVPEQQGKRESCLVITCEKDRGDTTPELSGIVRELGKEMRVITLILGENSAEDKLVGASDACLRLTGDFFDGPGEGICDILLLNLVRHLKPDYVITDTLTCCSRVNLLEFSGAAVLATLHQELDTPLFYEWDGVNSNVESRLRLMRAFLSLSRVVYASEAVAVTYKDRLAWSLPAPIILAPTENTPQGISAYVRRLLEHLQEAKRQNEQDEQLSRRIAQKPFPLWKRKWSHKRELNCYRKHIGAYKPYYGFHPLMYAEEHGISAIEALETALDTPLHNYTSINFNEYVEDVSRVKERVALHIHAFYPDLLEEILQRLSINVFRPDLYISTTEASRNECREICSRLGFEAKMCVFTNIGRDIAPMFTGFAEELRSYDIVGHVHTKKSPHANAAGIARARNGLYSNLIGYKDIASMDKLLTYMADHPDCGHFSPDYVGTTEWSGTYRLAQELMQKMGYGTELPQQLFFPIGTMFWYRPAAMHRIFEQKWDWSDYPPEPLNAGGTWLHALERLFVLIAQKEGYTFASSHINGVFF